MPARHPNGRTGQPSERRRAWAVVRAATLAGLCVAGFWALSGGAEAGPEEEGAVIRMPPLVTWDPASPGEGRLFAIRVTASRHTPIMGVRGEVSGEELHFRRLDERSFESLAAVPVGASGSVPAWVRVAYEAGGEQVIEESIPVTPGAYEHEELTVAPRFGAPPDSADAARLAGERAKAGEVSRIAHRTRRIYTGDVVAPRDSPVTSGFGDGREFNGRVSGRHMGLDLQGRRGDTVVAAARGVVALVDEFLLAGRLVYLNHGAGLVTGYFHLSEPLVQLGDTLEAGDPLGRVGATGRVTGPHLHWVVRFGATSVDPRSLLEIDAR